MRRFEDDAEDETYEGVSSRLENLGYLDRETMWAAFAAVVDHARWMGMSDADVQDAIGKATGEAPSAKAG